MVSSAGYPLTALSVSLVNVYVYTKYKGLLFLPAGGKIMLRSNKTPPQKTTAAQRSL